MVKDNQDNSPRSRKTYSKTKTVVTVIGPVDITLREHQVLKNKAFGRTEHYHCAGLNTLAKRIGVWRRGKGFHTPIGMSQTDERDKLLGKLMLVVTEAAEAVRHNDRPGLEEELADTIIRVLDITDALDIDISSAIARKMIVNEGRDYKHEKQTDL